MRRPPFSLLSFLVGAHLLVGCSYGIGKHRIGARDCYVVEAAYDGDIELLAAELDRGCSPEGDADMPNEPVYYAIVMGHVHIVELLVDRGVDPDFDWGERGGCLLTNAAQFGHTSIVRLLLEKGAEVNREVGHSALYRAIINGHEDLAEFLKSRGATLNAADRAALEALFDPRRE